MRLSLLPQAVAQKVTDISPRWLRAREIRLLMLDFDNTVVPYTTDDPTGEFLSWLQSLTDARVQVCVVSNSRKDRVVRFCRIHGIDCITRALKPLPRGISQCLCRYGIPPEEAALVGDQIFTDTLGGNLCGVTTVLVQPIDNHNFWLKARHVLEQPFIYLARKRRISNEEH